jgi:hypothetical protein
MPAHGAALARILSTDPPDTPTTILPYLVSGHDSRIALLKPETVKDVAATELAWLRLACTASAGGRFLGEDFRPVRVLLITTDPERRLAQVRAAKSQVFVVPYRLSTEYAGGVKRVAAIVEAMAPAGRVLIAVDTLRAVEGLDDAFRDAEATMTGLLAIQHMTGAGVLLWHPGVEPVAQITSPADPVVSVSRIDDGVRLRPVRALDRRTPVINLR